MSVWNDIEKQLQNVLEEPVQLSAPQAVGGGSINQSCRISSGQQSWFVKLNRAERLNMFVAEAEGLKIMSGYELFFYQGVNAFELFCGRHVDETALRRALLETVE